MFPVVGTTAFLMLAADRGRVRLQRAAVTDELTGLPNRRALTDAAHQRFATMAGGGQVGLILFDIDRFKSINDQHGHETGDRALAHVAAIVREVVAPPAIAGRFGGEEFLCVLPGADAHQAVALAERLRVTLASRPLSFRQGTLAVTASFGVVVAGPDGESLEHALARADTAMYRAKTEGRNRVMLGGV
jgi:diguanylate cyclase (GGDEF)-like protein